MTSIPRVSAGAIMLGARHLGLTMASYQSYGTYDPFAPGHFSWLDTNLFGNAVPVLNTSQSTATRVVYDLSDGTKTVFQGSFIPGQGLNSATITSIEHCDSNFNCHERIIGLRFNTPPICYNIIQLLDQMLSGQDFLNGSNSADSLFGKAGGDELYGYGGNDVLNGGLGADKMYGGTGNDTYFVDNVSDITIELPSEGIDSVKSTVSFTLSANIENLSLLGSANINGTGNALANVIDGNNGNNLLDGGHGNDTINGGAGNDILKGGQGADSMNGGAGNDVFYVDSSADVVFEGIGQGIDTVISQISYVLSTNLEHLTLSGFGDVSGKGNGNWNNITGNAGNNLLEGFAGSDTLNGAGGNDTLRGGVGADSLYGGSGNDLVDGGSGLDDLFGDAGDDVFVLQKLATDCDTIHDYVVANDQLQVSSSLFGLGLAPGSNLGSMFASNASGMASNAAQRFIYNTTSGALYFDLDGNGAGAAVHIATVYSSGTTPAAGLTAADFNIVT
jgi:Ca2+-binding RTX toxin-like protein